MFKSRRLKVLKKVFKYSGADKILVNYIFFVLLAALIIMLTEPKIDTYYGALWYCYAVISTAGFGDVVVTALIPRLISVLLTIYSYIALAILTGVIVNYFNQTIEIRNKETFAAFVDNLERLEELSKEELELLSEKVKKFRDT